MQYYYTEEKIMKGKSKRAVKSVSRKSYKNYDWFLQDIIKWNRVSRYSATATLEYNYYVTEGQQKKNLTAPKKKRKKVLAPK
jgi:hypothetical protein